MPLTSLVVASIRRAVRSRSVAGCAMLAVILSACSGNGEGLDANGRPLDGAGPGDATLQPSYADIQAQVLATSCAVSGCHSGSAAPLGLRLDAEVAFDNLVGVPSIQQPSLLRVAPGDPDNSYLVQKLEGTAAGGSRMPRNQPALSSDTIQIIRDWIGNGAPGPRFSAITRTVLNPICTNCHASSLASAGMSLEEGLAYDNLVNRLANDGTRLRVVPGDAGQSYLINKLTGEGLGENDGRRMPLGGPYLEDHEIAAIRQWIDDGAGDN